MIGGATPQNAKKFASPTGPNPFGYTSPMQANGQFINKGNLLSGLRHDSATQANTGTQTGNRAVQDFAKGQLYQNQANLGRQAETKGNQMQAQAAAQKEQLTQQGRSNRLNRYQQLTGQSVDQMNLANRLMQNQIEMQSQWRAGLLGLIS